MPEFREGPGAFAIPEFLTPENLAEFRDVVASLEFKDGVVLDGDATKDIDPWRSCSATNLLEGTARNKVHRKASFWFNEANTRHFNYALSIDWFRPTEGIVICRYGVGDHFYWHRDWEWSFHKEHPNRLKKLSLVIQLSSPDEYEGGDLQVFGGRDQFVADKTPGSAVIFPSHHFHQVTDITSGTRLSALMFCHGDLPFK